jgi:hypothetical protein
VRAFDIIETANQLVGGDRAKQHGDKRRNFQTIANMWSAYLGDQLAKPLTPEQIAWLMVLLKVARTKSGSKNVDNAIDAVGYSGIAGELMEEPVNEKEPPAQEMEDTIVEALAGPQGCCRNR